MERHLSDVAIGGARTELSANIRLMGRFFEQGVPADTDTCIRMMRALTVYADGGMSIKISKVFSTELSLLPAGCAKVLDDDSDNDFPQCDAYGEDEKALIAEFYERVENKIRRVGSIRARATLDGFRQFIRDVRSASRALRNNGLCPECPDRATASMRLPHAGYCGECCFKVAILGTHAE